MKKHIFTIGLLSTCFFCTSVLTYANDDANHDENKIIASNKQQNKDAFFPANPSKEDIEGDKVKAGDIPLPQEVRPASSAFRSAGDLDAVNSEIVELPIPKVLKQWGSQLPVIAYQDGVGKPRGVVIHETANPTSTIEGEINYMFNNYNNAFVHAYADKNQVIEVHNTDYASWGAGRYANAHFIHIELVEHPGNRDAFYRSINNQAYYAALKLKQYGLKPSRAQETDDPTNPKGSVWGHFEVASLLGGTDHGDPLGYYRQFGYTFYQFFDLVEYHYNNLMGNVLSNVEVKDKPVIDLVDKSFSIYNEIPGTGKNEYVIGKTSDIDETVRLLRVAKTPKKTYAYIQWGHSGGWVEHAALQTGWIQEDNHWIYKDQYGKKLTGFQKIGSHTYYLNDKGVMLRFWQKINGTYYYFNGSGYMLTGWQFLNGHWYYLQNDGKMMTGYQKIGGDYYLLNSQGQMMNGWQKVNGKDAYFDKSGKRLFGYQKIDGKEYFFLENGDLAKPGWVKLNGNYYYFQKGKGLLTGFQTISGVTYHFDNNGKMSVGWKFMTSNNRWYYFKSNGYMKVGWMQENGKWYHMKDNGIMDCYWVKINNKWYYFNSSGVMKTGWLQYKNHWYYLASNGEMKTGWQKIDGKEYYFNSNGVMQTGTVNIGNEDYIFKPSGQLAVGWMKQNNKWYYYDNNQNKKTGWQKISGVWYYLDNSTGAMKTGWQKIDGDWFYFNGSGNMKIGWQFISGVWYYLDYGGQMKTGWQWINNKWYYFNGSGYMKTGWQQIGSTWYHFKSNGAMETGWITVYGKNYYMESNGAMRTRPLQANGVTYTFNDNGSLINLKKNESTLAAEAFFRDFPYKEHKSTIEKSGYYLYPENYFYQPVDLPVLDTSSILGETYDVIREIKTSKDRYGLINVNGTKYWVSVKSLRWTNHKDNFVDSIIAPAVSVTKNHDQFASVMIAQAILESGYGESTLASKYHNYFGIKAGPNDKNIVKLPTKEWNGSQYIEITATFKAYNSREESFEDRCRFIEKGGNTGNPNFYTGAFKSVAGTYQNATKYLTGRYATAWDYNINLNNLIDYWDLATLD